MRRGAQLAGSLCYRQRQAFFSIDGVAALPGGAGCGVSLQATSTSTPQQKPFLRHGAEGLHARPAASGCAGSQSQAPCSFPARQLPLPAPVW
ncbi:hypothetical protein G5646_21585, partial [Pectobacterium atrosepticum]|nr:hypothetical protein [Pectobacterium atrosepticum]